MANYDNFLIHGCDSQSVLTDLFLKFETSFAYCSKEHLPYAFTAFSGRFAYSFAAVVVAIRTVRALQIM